MLAVGPDKKINNEKKRGPIRCIAILAALKSELEPVRRSLGISSKPLAGEDFCRGTYRGVTVITAVTNVGVAAAQAAAENVFARYGATIDHLFVVGTAGAFELQLSIGEVLIPESVVDHRDGIVRRTVNLSANAPSGVIYSADKGNFDDEYVAALNRNNVSCIDTDSAAITAVCGQQGCPVTIVKAVSDKVDLLVESREVFYLTDSPDYRDVLRFALRRPQRIAYIIALTLGAKKAIAAASAELLRNIDRLLQQPQDTDDSVDSNVILTASRLNHPEIVSVVVQTVGCVSREPHFAATNQ